MAGMAVVDRRQVDGRLLQPTILLITLVLPALAAMVTVVVVLLLITSLALADPTRNGALLQCHRLGTGPLNTLTRICSSRDTGTLGSGRRAGGTVAPRRSGVVRVGMP